MIYFWHELEVAVFLKKLTGNIYYYVWKQQYLFTKFVIPNSNACLVCLCQDSNSDRLLQMVSKRQKIRVNTDDLDHSAMMTGLFGHLWYMIDAIWKL